MTEFNHSTSQLSVQCKTLIWIMFITGHFHQGNLRTVLLHYYQHVNFATRGENKLDWVYTNIKQAFRADPHPHLGNSDHFSVMLISAIRPLLTRSKTSMKQIRTWPKGVVSALQDCFECMNWNATTVNQNINLG